LGNKHPSYRAVFTCEALGDSTGLLPLYLAAKAGTEPRPVLLRTPRQLPGHTEVVTHVRKEKVKKSVISVLYGFYTTVSS